MPALNLDAAFVRTDLGDEGNAAYTGIDPYFDDLFLMSGARPLVGGKGERCHRADRSNRLSPQQLLVNRMMVDTVVEALNGAHFPPTNPTTGATRSSSGHYAEAGSDETWAEFVSTYLSVSGDQAAAVRKFRRPDRRPPERVSVSRGEVCAVACAELFRDAGEIMVSPMTTVVSIVGPAGPADLLPDIVLTDGEARLIADTPAIGAPPSRAGCRSAACSNAGLGPAP